MVDKLVPEKVEVDAYVIPTLGSYTAYVDLDLDDYARKHGRNPCEISVNVYSPGRLSEGELTEVSVALEEQGGCYLCRLEFSRETFKWLKWMALVEGGIVAGMVASDFVPLYPMRGLSIYFRAVIDIFFWGALIFGPVTISGIRVLTHFGKERRARMLVDNWKGTNAIEGLNREKNEMVKAINKYWLKLDGREIKIYKEMRNYCEKQGYTAPYEFYNYKVENLEKGKSFYLKYRPTSFKEKLRNIFLGPKIESPKIQTPMKVMELRGRSEK